MLIVHECYVLTLTSSEGYLSEAKHDIAIIRLETPVNNFAPIQITNDLNSDTYAFDSDNNGPYATAAGWGLTVNGDWTSGADILQHVEIPVRFDATCGTYWNSRFFNANVNVCAAGAGTTVDTCQGDSGGPLFVDDPHFSGDPSDVPKLVGLVSLGAGCGLTYPSVFVEVAAYRDWICRNTEEMIAQHSLPAAAKVQGCA